jgi:hypothetical protein
LAAQNINQHETVHYVKTKPLDATHCFDKPQVLVQATMFYKALKNYGCHKHCNQQQNSTSFKESGLCNTFLYTSIGACMQEEKFYKLPQTFSLGTKTN